MDLRNKITLMALSDITPYENNPRNNEEAVEKVANSIKEFGFNQPIVVDKDNVYHCRSYTLSCSAGVRFG